MDGGDITMTNMEMLLNKLKKAKLRTPKASAFKQYLYDIDDKKHWKNRKVNSIVKEFYIAKYELWNNRLIKRVFYVEQKWLFKEKQYCNIYEVQRFLAGSYKKINKYIYSASFGGVRPTPWHSYEYCTWEEGPFDSMVCSGFYNYNRQIDYFCMNDYKDLLKKSVHKYCGFEYSGLDEDRLFWYLYQYEKHPQMEMISKMGLMDCVRGNMNCMRWSQKGYKLLGLENKAELEKVKLCNRFGGLKYYRKHRVNIKKYNIDTEHKLIIYDTLHERNIRDISKKMIEYIDNYDRELGHIYFSNASIYADYIGFCNRLGIPLSSPVKYPKNLREAHDNLQNKIVIKNLEDKTKRIQEQVIKRLYKYRYADERFVITPANSAEDLANESKALNHCVRTYTDRYADGITSIFLIRKRDDVMTPFYTLELKNKKVNQVRGHHNCDPTDDVKNFVGDWCKRHKLDTEIYQNY